MMRALQLDGFSDRPRTRMVDLAGGTIGDSDVRVRIEAACLNPLDAKIATGAMNDWFPVGFPYVPGTDFAGVVELAGSEVTDLRVGDAVFGRSNPVSGGAIAEAIVLDSGLVAHRPLSLTASQAACLPTTAGIAWQVLGMMGRADDDPVLILGNGAVARMALALIGSAANQAITTDDLLRSSRTRYVIDTVGGELQRTVLEMLPSGSHLVALSTPPDLTLAGSRDIRADFAVLATDTAQLGALADAADRGILRPRVDVRIALQDAPSVFDRYVAREIGGKIVIGGEQ